MNNFTPEQVQQLTEQFNNFSLDDQRAMLSGLARQKVKVKGQTLVGRRNPPSPLSTTPSSHTDIPEVETKYDVPGIVQYPKDVTFAPEPFEPKPIEKPPEKSLLAKLGHGFVIGPKTEETEKSQALGGEIGKKIESQLPTPTNIAAYVAKTPQERRAEVASSAMNLAFPAITVQEIKGLFSPGMAKDTAEALAKITPKGMLDRLNVKVESLSFIRTVTNSKTAVGYYDTPTDTIVVSDVGKKIFGLRTGGISPKSQAETLTHEWGSHFFKAHSSSEEFQAALFKMQDMGIRADYDLIAKHWNEAQYGKVSEVTQASEALANTIEKLSPGEISQVWQLELQRNHSKDVVSLTRDLDQAMKLKQPPELIQRIQKQLETAKQKSDPYWIDFYEKQLARAKEGKSQLIGYSPTETFEKKFKDSMPGTSSLMDHLAFRDNRTGEIVSGESAWSHADAASKQGFPLDPNIQEGWMIDGKFYTSTTNAMEAFKKMGTNVPKTKVQTGAGGFLSFDGIKQTLSNIRDKVTLQVVPKMTRAGVQDSAIIHASARNAINPMSKDFISRLSPDGIRNLTSKEMEDFSRVMNADRILGGYDEFLNMAARERDAGNLSVAGRWEAQASRIAQKHGLANLEATVQAGRSTPTLMDTVNKWKTKVEPELTEMYNEELGFDPLTPRDGKGRYFDTYFPLVTKDKEENWLKFIRDDREPMPEASATHYMNPHQRWDPFTQAAKYTGDYSTNLEAIMPNLLSRRYENVTRWRMYQDLVDKGAAVWGEGIPKPDLLNGKEVKAMSVKVPSVSEAGKSRNVFKTLYVQSDLVGELNRVLNTDFAAARSKSLNLLTNIQLAQFADLVTHTKNLLSAMSVAQGAGSTFKDVVRQIPILGSADGVARIASTWREVLQDSPSIRAEIADMSKKGLLRPYFPPSGIGAVTKSQEFLYRVDTAARIQMNRFFDNLVGMGKATDSAMNRFNFVNQCGQYNKRLMGPLMQKMKDAGVAPFIVAGRNFNRQARRRLFGSPGVEATSDLAAAQMRLVHLAGVGMLFSLPMMLNTITTGKPGGRPGTPLGAWDLGKEPDEKGKFKTLDLLQATGIRRGMRSIGLEAAIEGIRQGHTANQITGKMATDIVSTAAHPWTGPGISGVAHIAPVVVPSMGKYAYGATLTDHVENMREFAENQNPLLYSAMRPALVEMGIDKNPDKPYGKDFATQFFLRSPFQAFGVKDTAPAQSGAEKEAHDIISGHFHSVMDKSDKERFAAQSALVNAIRRGKASPDEKKLLKESMKKGALDSPDIEKAMKRGSVSQLESYLDRLNPKETMRVFKAAKATSNKKDMALIAPKLMEKFQNADPRIQQELMDALGGKK